MIVIVDFVAASHRNTNKIFNVGVRDFAWLQNPKAYKKHRVRVRVRFFLFPPPINRSLMAFPIPNRFTQTLGFPSPMWIIQNL